MPSFTSITRMREWAERSALRALWCCGARCCTNTMARSGSAGSASSSCENASKPPADAPTPTMENVCGCACALRSLDGMAASAIRTCPALARSCRTASAPRRAAARSRTRHSEQNIAKSLDTMPQIGHILFNPGKKSRQIARSRAVGHALPKLERFFKRPQGAPQNIFQLAVLRRDEALGREAVPHVTAISGEIAVFRFPQRAAAIGTGEWRRRTIEGFGFERIRNRMFRRGAFQRPPAVDGPTVGGNTCHGQLL